MGDKEPKYAQELESTGSVINAVATTDGAIGYASLANVDETVKALKIGGVEATEENVKSGAYEVQRPFICATSLQKLTSTSFSQKKVRHSYLHRVQFP